MVNPILMQPRVAKLYVHHMDDIARQFLQRIDFLLSRSDVGEMPHNFMEEIYKVTFESVAFIAIDKRFGWRFHRKQTLHLLNALLAGTLNNDADPNSESQKLIRSAVEMFHLLHRLELEFSLWKLYSTKDWRRFVQVLDYITKLGRVCSLFLWINAF